MPASGPALSWRAVPAEVHTNTANTTATGIQVVCAFPVSGQYGPGSRFLYYAFIAACVVARKAEWVRNACLAGALIFPAVAGVHGVVLAIVHNQDAVDMDVYGAFQFCAIGILAAPVTVRMSRTYFNNPGRNIIFIWCALVLAGLISLTVAFYRDKSTLCLTDNDGNPLTSDPSAFFNTNANCSIVCNDINTTSPLRGGSGNNIYLIPAPTVLTFNAATLLAAACCIPGILLLVAMWLKILQTNWRARFAVPQSQGFGDLRTPRVFKAIRKYAESVVFGMGVFAILILGEINFFSVQVDYQTEPIGNVGQWAPIVGTGLAIMASMYMLMAEAMVEERERRTNPEEKEEGRGIMIRVAKLLLNLGDYFGNPAANRFGENDFRRGSVLQYPEVPGEDLRNPDLKRTRSNYDPKRDSQESFTSHMSRLSRARSGTATSMDATAAVAGATCSLDGPTTTTHSSAERIPTRSSTDGQRVSVDRHASVPRRRDTLEVPTGASLHRANTGHNTISSSPTRGRGDSNALSDPDEILPAPLRTAMRPRAPTIVVSPNADDEG